MRMVDIIAKKRNGGTLSNKEIEFVVSGCTNGTIPDYQLSAFLMAVFFRSMNSIEVCEFTRQIIRSGRCMDLASLDGVPVDKHSTGGVGDKVSVILAPMVAACGVPVPMMSGRALGHTGGTLDKLESIPGYRTTINAEQADAYIRDNGYVMMGQTEDLVPADKKFYALRDVTATVESIPLIVSSILSKKFAEGAEALVMDVKCGSGAFLKTLGDARELANALCEIGRKLERRIVAVISNMNTPLGYTVGNFLEMEEAAHCLCGEIDGEQLSEDYRSRDLMEVTLRLGGWMLVLGGKADTVEQGEMLCRGAIEDGRAWRFFLRNMELQGGDCNAFCASIARRRSNACQDIIIPAAGYLCIDAFSIAMCATMLGAGRETQEKAINPDVGVELLCKEGATVTAGDSVLRLWYDEIDSRLDEALQWAEQSLRVTSTAPDATMILQELA